MIPNLNLDIDYRLLFVYTWGETQCGIYTSTLCEINYVPFVTYFAPFALQ